MERWSRPEWSLSLTFTAVHLSSLTPATWQPLPRVRRWSSTIHIALCQCRFMYPVTKEKSNEKIQGAIFYVPPASSSIWRWGAGCSYRSPDYSERSWGRPPSSFPSLHCVPLSVKFSFARLTCVRERGPWQWANQSSDHRVSRRADVSNIPWNAWCDGIPNGDIHLNTSSLVLWVCLI